MDANGPLSPERVVDDQPDHLPAYLSSGTIGLRVRQTALRPGLAAVSGLEGEHPGARVAASAPAPYPLAGDLRIGEVWMSNAWHQVSDIEQQYDFACGELHTHFVYRSDGTEATVDVMTLCSRSDPTLVLQEISVSCNRACDVELAVGVDPTDVPGRCVERQVRVPGTDGRDIDGLLLWETLGGLGRCGAAYWSEVTSDLDYRSVRSEDLEAPLRTTMSARLRGRQRFVVRQVTSLVPSAAHSEPHRQATRLVASGRRLGFESLRERNAAEWRELWKGRVVLVGADRRWQQLADAAFFYLNSSVHRSSLASVHPFGLAQWHGYHYYYGHVMWDVETFILPSLLFSQPDAARAILDYRSSRIDAARGNAKLSGYVGLQYPWESSASQGEEAAPHLGPAAAYEHHVTLDVALAFAQYAHATGDDYFLRNSAWPVLAGACQWLESRVVRSDRGWEIRRAMGIAEREEPSDNVAFVNLVAKRVLREASECAERLGRVAPPKWREIEEGLVVPFADDGCVILDHDGYSVDEEKGDTPAVLAAFYPMGYRAADDVERASLAFYLERADDYAGSPMLSALLGTWAARLGDRRRSAHLFEEGYGKFVSPRFLNVHEYRADKFPEQPVAGPFYANIGGFLMGCMFGLTGIRPSAAAPDMWCERSALMPDTWDGVEIERAWVRGRPASIHAMHGDEHATIELLD
jgi:trehalose/maltose hydrolase-like predicted phosphorylase